MFSRVNLTVMAICSLLKWSEKVCNDIDVHKVINKCVFYQQAKVEFWKFCDGSL